ncbi:MAG: ABC transporter ATP-binding protein [Planctomycetales bacterium]
MNAAPAIEVQDLRKTYRDGLFIRRSVAALRGVSFSVERGTIFGLLGPNGAGKTTLIKILLGIVRKSSGSATLLGRPAGDRSGRGSVGYLPEHHRIPRHHTGQSALEYYGALSNMPMSEMRQRIPELLGLVGLADWGTTSVKKYSKGMLQRLGLAQAMLHNPDLLILDEPTDGVDPVGRTEMRAILQKLKQEGKTIFINSHLLQEIELVCDRVAILVQGELRREGLIAELTKRRNAEIEFTLSGSPKAIDQALDGYPFARRTSAAAGDCRVQLEAAGQAEMDRLIDAFRRANVSIISCGRRRDTLEEAFLEIVGEGK